MTTHTDSQTPPAPTPQAPGAAPAGKRRSLLPLYAVLLLSLAPVIAAAVVYFMPEFRPGETTNYGTLVEPQRPMPPAAELPLATLDGQPFDLNSLKGRWVLAAADGAECPESCARKLFILRNTHASQGKNVERLVRVWFITDDAAVPQKVLDAYQGTVMVRVDPERLKAYLPTGGQESLADPLWVIDPLGNLILRYPAEADAVKFRKDVSKIVYNSRIG